MTTATPYGKVGAHLAAGDIDFTTDTIKLALLDDTHVSDLDAHEFWSDVSADEAVGTGYTAGGATLGTKSTTYITADNQTAHKCDPVAWDATGGSLAARYAVLYKDNSGVAATSPLLGLITFEDPPGTPATLTATGAPFTITPDATNGILKL